MKQGHFIVLFMILYCFCFLSLWLEQWKYDAVLAEKEQVEKALKMAIEYSAQELIGVLKEPIEVQTEVVEASFFKALQVALGMVENAEEQEQLRTYVPMLVLVLEEGAVFYHAQNTINNGVQTMKYGWSEFCPFAFAEEYTEEMKKCFIAEYLERAGSGIISNHNFIAQQYGMTYAFHVPVFLQDTSERLQLPMVLAVFQGWPLDAARSIFYENCVDAGVYIQEVKKYVVEVPMSLEDSFCYYHIEDCDLILNETRKIIPKQYSKQEAMEKFGARACAFCID